MTEQNGDRKHSWVLSLLDRYEVKLTHYAMRILGDLGLAQDVVQQTFLKLCKLSPEDIEQSPEAWLYTVCRNQALDELRKRQRMRTTVSPKWESISETNATDPTKPCETQDLWECLQDIVRNLPQRQREVLVLWADGLSYREIALITQHKEISVRVLMHRALKRLRKNPNIQRWIGETNRRTANRSQSIEKHQIEQPTDSTCQSKS